jgi:hypothetical protein
LPFVNNAPYAAICEKEQAEAIISTKLISKWCTYLMSITQEKLSTLNLHRLAFKACNLLMDNSLSTGLTKVTFQKDCKTA